MSDIKSDMTPTMRLAKLMAEMHYYYAKELIDRLGPKEGRSAVRHALKCMAESRSDAMGCCGKRPSRERKRNVQEDQRLPDSRLEQGCERRGELLSHGGNLENARGRSRDRRPILHDRL